MRIIKDQQITENVWTHANDDAAISENCNVTVTLDRWINHKEQLSNRCGKTGVRLTPTDKVEDLAGKLTGLDLIELDFPGFGDGRLFSHARLLRAKLHYRGELRAVGNYLPDQAYFLSRVGVNSFLPMKQEHIPLTMSCLSDFSVTYQPSTN